MPDLNLLLANAPPWVRTVAYVLGVLVALSTAVTALSKAPLPEIPAGAGTLLRTVIYVQWAAGVLSLMKHDTATLPGLPASPMPKSADAPPKETP